MNSKSERKDKNYSKSRYTNKINYILFVKYKLLKHNEETTLHIFYLTCMLILFENTCTINPLCKNVSVRFRQFDIALKLILLKVLIYLRAKFHVIRMQQSSATESMLSASCS